MSVNLSIKNARDDVVRRLRVRAARNHRSLQGELMTIIETAAGVEPAAALPDGKQLSVDELLAEVRKLRVVVPADSGRLLRADRDRDESR